MSSVKIFHGVFLCALSPILFVVPASAETPSEITQRLIKQLESKQELAPAFDYVDWEGAFKQVDPALKARMGLRSANDYRNQEVERYNGQDKISQGLDSAISTADPEHKKRLTEMKEHLSKSLDNQKAETEKAFAETEYTIGDETIDGDTAEVKLIKKRNQSVNTDTLEFVKSGGNWKLKSAAPLNPTSPVGGKDMQRGILGPPVAMPTEGIVRPF